jgi:3-hydroxybutyryl-CoA dehydrogenase
VNNERIIGVIGAGTMGAGIAHAAAVSGLTTRLIDVEPPCVEQALEHIRHRLDDRVARGKMPAHDRDAAVSRLHVARGYDDFADAECVIEAVTEDLALKRKIFGELDRIVSDRTLLASNTSSLSIAKIGEGLRRADRFLGMHFFNPAPVMKLVEIVRGPATSDQAMVDARAVVLALDKTPVKVTDSPGFIGNRVNRPFYLESLRLVQDGEGDIRAIDSALRDVGGFRLGPFELMDLIGIDVNLRVSQTVFEDFKRPPRFTPSEIQEKLVKAGHLGRKTKRGFYDYANGEPVPAFESKTKSASGWKPSAALKVFAECLDRPADRAMWMYARVLLAVVNEAALVADTIALPRDVNLTMELGFNYPQGPLGTADMVGLDIVLDLMNEFHRQTGGDERFAPAALLQRHVEVGELGEKTAKGFLHHWL